MQNAVAEDLPSSWANIPSSLLKAELSRRKVEAERPQCGSGGAKKEYNLPLHVFALFLILILSTLACSFPILVRRVPRLPIPHRFLFLSRHFGTGVLIATAFVHLLPTAFVSLTDPCLPPFWNQGYPAMPGFIAMVSVMVVVGIEQVFAMKGAGHSHESEYTVVREGQEHSAHQHASKGPVRPRQERTESYRPFKQGHIGPLDDSLQAVALEDTNGWQGNGNMVSGRSSSGKQETKRASAPDHDVDIDSDGPNSPQTDRSRFLTDREAMETRSVAHDEEEEDEEDGPGPASGISLSEHQQQQKMLLQCLLLEAGILFHSVFIGMAVSVATGTSFIVLLVAISFHQTFEGLALGSRIAAITAFPKHSPKPWLMALAYGTTTPVGQAIGLLVHNLYDPSSQVGLLMVGIMNAISSGLLLFAGLVELLAEDFLSDQSYESLRGQKRLQACASVIAGALLMALVGAWA